MPLSVGQGGDPTLVRTGAHKITFDPTGYNKTVGFTHGNITLTISPQTRKRYANEFGTTPLDEITTGVEAVAKFTMLERSLKTLDIALHGIYPLSWKTATTSRGIGRSGTIAANAKGVQLLLHPLYNTGTTQDITLFKAFLRPVGSWTLDETGDQMMDVEAHCVVDITQTDGALLLTIGETNVGA